jgi:uncharacterized protein YciI
MDENNEFVYMLKPVRLEMLTDEHTPEEDQIISEHVDYLKKITENGTLILAGRTLNRDSSGFGIVIFNANSEEEANEIMLKDPAVKKNILKGTLFPYQIAFIKKHTGHENCAKTGN